MLGTEKEIFECFCKEPGFDVEGNVHGIEQLLGRQISHGMNGGKCTKTNKLNK